METQTTRDVAEAIVPSAWVVGPRSMMIDRVVPRLEFLWMPKTVQPGGTISLCRAESAPERRIGWRVHAHRLLRKDYGAAPVDGPILDLRQSHPSNWAHAQIIHLPLAAMARDWLGTSPTVLLTNDIPKYVVSLFAHFGFAAVATDREVTGTIVLPSLSSTDVMRPVRRTLVAPLVAELDHRRALGKLPTGLPTKIFVSRRATRRIENEAEIEAELARDGYTKLYPETMSVPEQIELFNTATNIVAIHGAALAPLLFRSQQAPPFDLVEILSPAHMANSYRLMAAQTGGRYIGVRGRMKPDYVEPAYRLNRIFHAYSLADFSVDLESLRAARAILRDGAPPEFVA